MPSIEGKPGIWIQGTSDPNGSGKFEVRIDYAVSPGRYFRESIEINNKIFISCGEGLVRHSSSSGHSGSSGSAEYKLENTTNTPIRISSGDYVGLPRGYQAPEFIIPPSGRIPKDQKVMLSRVSCF